MKNLSFFKFTICLVVTIILCFNLYSQVQITGLTATASKYDGSANTPDKAVDGNTSTGWFLDTGSGTDWLQVTMQSGQYYVLSQIKLYVNTPFEFDNCKVQLIKDGAVLLEIPISFTGPLVTINPTLTQTVNAVKILGDNADMVSVFEVQLYRTLTVTSFESLNAINVGIGTSSPQTPLHIKSLAEMFRLETTGTTGQNYISFKTSSATMGTLGYLSSSDNSFRVANNLNAPVIFFTNNIERMRIESNGKVGIGALPTTTDMLFVNGNLNATSISTAGAITAGSIIVPTINSTSNMTFQTNGTSQMTINATSGLVTTVGGLTVGGALTTTGTATLASVIVPTINSTSNITFQTNGTPRMTINNSTGYVGIGASPTTTDMLFVNGNIKATSISSTGTISIPDINVGNSLMYGNSNSSLLWSTSGNGTTFKINLAYISSTRTSAIFAYDGTTFNDLGNGISFNNSGVTNLIIKSGKVGIGANPTATDLLYVNGNINANSISTGSFTTTGTISSGDLKPSGKIIFTNNSNTYQNIFYDGNLNFQVGQLLPIMKLSGSSATINGSLSTTSLNSTGNISATGNISTTSGTISAATLTSTGNITASGNISTTSGTISAATLSSTSVIASGNVCIGTSTMPSGYLLAVNGNAGIQGTLIAEEVKVQASAWSDYVFNKYYKLRPLSSLEKYIQENKHLPEIPTTNEVEKNGIKISEMNTLLLKKVEELTLYIIEQDKLLKQQGEKIKELEDFIYKK